MAGIVTLMLNKYLKYFHTLKYLKPRQTIGRSFAGLKKRFNNKTIKLPETVEPAFIKSKTEFLCYDPWNSRIEILKGNFKFLNETEHLGHPVNWKQESVAPLWDFNLHYFNFLHLLIKEEQIVISHDWIDNNPFTVGTGWSPYTISLRVVNWCKAGIDDKKINESLFLQAEYLYNNLEFYHPGNHYLENAKALIFVGLYFREHEQAIKWFDKGAEIFLHELKIQVLRDGGYFEKTQMYHAIMLHGFLDLINILPTEEKLYSELISTSKMMLDFLISNTHPNGEIALFNDSTREIAPSTKTLIDYAEKLVTHDPIKQSSFPESGYYIYDDDEIYFIVDGGSIGPDYLPAHAHADIFSFELSLFGNKVVTDTGVYEYTRGSVRENLRSTNSHNTVSVDDVSQVECWDSFRVARRYKPKIISFEKSANGFRFKGMYNGYSKLIGDNIVHEREINFDKRGRQILVSEIISGKNEHSVKSFLHFTPDCKIFSDKNSLKISQIDKNIDVIIKKGNFKIEDSFYYPEFGIKEEIKKVVIEQNCNLPAQIEYLIKF